jgi:hypothetical protein
MNHGRRTTSGLFAALIASALPASAPSVAQNAAPAAAQNEAPSSIPNYVPPSRGAPGGRVSAGTRGKGDVRIDPLAPDGHAGQTASAAPTLYFFVSQPITAPTQFTISAPSRPSPILEVNIPAPRDRGIYSFRTADHRLRLEAGILYTWSVSAIIDPKQRSQDIVASAQLLRTVPSSSLEASLRSASPLHRAGIFAQAGLWYDAVAAAAESAALDRHAALDSLMTQVGLAEAARYDRENVAANRLR